MKYKDYYTIIDVPKTATQDEVKRAYRKKAGQLHPDKNPNDKKAEQGFKDLQEAYEVLKDPEKRKLYDKVGSNWKQYQQTGADPNSYNWQQWGGGGNPFGGSSSRGGDFSDFFETIFGGAGARGFGSSQGFGNGFQQSQRQQQYQQQKAAPQTIESTLEVSLDELFHGSEKSVVIHGKQIKVKIPKGIEDGKKLKLKGKGPHGADILLVIKTQLRSNYERNGADLTHIASIPLWDAILGTQITIKTFKGDVNLKIPELSKPESSLRLKGFGLPKFHHSTESGDLFVKIRYAMPDSLSDKERMLLKELKH